MRPTPRPRSAKFSRPRGPAARLALVVVAGGALVLGVVPAQAQSPPRSLSQSPARAPSGPVAWEADLSVPAGARAYGVRRDGSGIALAATARVAASLGSDRRTGSYTLPPRRLAAAVDRVSAVIDADTAAGGEVAVRVRGQDREGRWTEWRQAGPGTAEALPRAADRIQVRLELTGGLAARARVNRVALRAYPAGPESVRRAARGAAPLTFRLFATREGLVGGTTANGHVIVERDHFVALPSRRGLNPNDSTRDFQVQVCYQVTGRCEIAPVWDVGPWNTRDDYWNPSAEREMWQDLPQGLPESQAAYIDGYNGGLDQFGRRVLNPAGIDLADGTFWDGLGMSDNDWVDVTFLWTG